MTKIVWVKIKGILRNTVKVNIRVSYLLSVLLFTHLLSCMQVKVIMTIAREVMVKGYKVERAFL